MKNGIRTLRQEQNIALWSNQIEKCNTSGLSVAKWCRENNIVVSTYWSRQRKVFEVFSKDSANGFVEVTVQPEISSTSTVAATISSGKFIADLHNEAEFYSDVEKKEEVKVTYHTRKKKTDAIEKLPENIKTVIVEHTLPEAEQVCNKCGPQLDLIYAA